MAVTWTVQIIPDERISVQWALQFVIISITKLGGLVACGSKIYLFYQF